MSDAPFAFWLGAEGSRLWPVREEYEASVRRHRRLLAHGAAAYARMLGENQRANPFLNPLDGTRLWDNS